MKIALSDAAPIYIARRKLGGAEIIQGRSRVKLSIEEMAALGRALTDMSTNDVQEDKEKMTTNDTSRY